jgi:adenylate cyclase
VLAFGLPMLAATHAMFASGVMIGSVVLLNSWLCLDHGLVLPLASALAMALSVVALNMSYGYWVESRSKRELAHLFGTYVPPELVEEMVKDPDRYTMQATAREMTVMFCDMRGFTRLSEHMDPGQVQQLLNALFSRLTRIIRNERGTVDKYIGDCIMAFWGAPVESDKHAAQAVRSALAMVAEIQTVNLERLALNERPIAIGIGLHTGLMCVGDMGSDVRRSYTVVGDAVNLGSRLEGLTRTYGVDIVASEVTRNLATGFLWQEIDRVRVKGREQAVTIYRPLAAQGAEGSPGATEMMAWSGLLKSYRAQDWAQCELFLIDLIRMDAENVLYHLYAGRVAARKRLPPDPEWDGATDIETK